MLRQVPLLASILLAACATPPSTEPAAPPATLSTSDASSASATEETADGSTGSLDPPVDPEPPVAPPVPLTALLMLTRRDYARDADVEIEVELHNAGSGPLEVPAELLETSVLLLEVRDKKGARVRTVPPPVPRGEMLTFAPGETRTAHVRLNVFSPPLPRGEYTVLPNGPSVLGNVAPFRIR